MFDDSAPDFKPPAVPAGRSLFERLEQAGASATPLLDELGDVVESIKRHLVRLLNAHPGASPCVPELGLLDFNDATLGTLDLGIRVRNAIRQCIERFEPRVNRVNVLALPQDTDPLQLRFQVTVHLRVAAIDDKAIIDLLLDDKRYYRVV